MHSGEQLVEQEIVSDACMAEQGRTTEEQLRQKLDAIAAKDFIPRELLEIVGRVAERQMEAVARCRVEVPDSDLAAPDKHALGCPLFSRSAFPYDTKQVLGLTDEFLKLLEEVGGDMARAAHVVRQEANNGGLDMSKAVRLFLDGDTRFFDIFSEKTPWAPRTLPFLIQSGLAPSLEAAAGSLNGRHDFHKAWNHAMCPVCGEPPLIARLKETEGYRYLTCSFCRAEYRAKRIACPFCNETKSDNLLFFLAEDEPGFRVDTCSTCKMYIKTVDFRQEERISIPLLDDLESLALDVLAAKEGFSRPTLSGWGF